MRRAIIASAIVLSAVLTGCSLDVDSEPSADPTTSSPSTPSAELSPSSSEGVTNSTPCGKRCSNQEVKPNDCDLGQVQTVGKLIEVDPKTVAGVAGVLELRMADPNACESIFWARFRPYASATRNWVVSIKVSGRPYEDQFSELGPNVDAYTEGVYAKPGADITYCLTQAPTDGNAQACAMEHINQGGG